MLRLNSTAFPYNTLLFISSHLAGGFNPLPDAKVDDGEDEKQT